MLRAVRVFPSKCVCIAYTSIFDPAYVGCRPNTIVNPMGVQSTTYMQCEPHGLYTIVNPMGFSLEQIIFGTVVMGLALKVLITIIIIAPQTIVKEDQWGNLECLHKACQAAKTDEGLFTDTGVDERCENERQGENDCEMKTVSSALV